MTGYRFQTLFLKFNRTDKRLRKPFRPKKANTNTVQATNDH
jgi:hypothetical protein